MELLREVVAVLVLVRVVVQVALVVTQAQLVMAGLIADVVVLGAAAAVGVFSPELVAIEAIEAQITTLAVAVLAVAVARIVTT
jgi:hypothetical protein